MPEFPHKDLTYKIIGAAMEVHRELKNGLDEKLYENALIIELTNLGHTVESQKQYSVEYKGRYIGKLIPDLIVDNSVIIETKVVTEFNASHHSQLLGYLNITKLSVGLLLNFKHSSLQHERLFNRPSQPPPNLQ